MALIKVKFEVLSKIHISKTTGNILNAHKRKTILMERASGGANQGEIIGIGR